MKLCDEMGLYVLEEIPLGFGGDLLLDESFAGPVLLRAREVLRRDSNRSSVIIWSLGNEDPLTDIHLTAARYIKGADPTRPMLSTEYTHGLGDHDFGGLADRWEAITSHAAGAGGFIWHWEDQGLKRDTAGHIVLDPVADLGKYLAVGSELVRHDQLDSNKIMDSHGVFGTDGIVNSDRTLQRDYWETKAVYAPVRVMAEELPYRPGQPTAYVPIRNDYDFTDLGAVAIHWQLMQDDRELTSGDAHINTPPHTVGLLQVPLAAMGGAEPAAYSVQLSFRRPDLSEITARSVHLLMPPRAPVAAVPERPRVATDGPVVTMTAADVSYRFDVRTAQLGAVTAGGTLLVTGARLSIWRPLSFSETRLYRGGDDKQLPRVPDLSRYQTSVRSWTATDVPDGVLIAAETEQRIDDKLDPASDGAGALHVLTSVVGRSTKFKRPEKPEDRLDLTDGTTFTGGFTISVRR